jgi:hypothetical protein
MRRSKEGVALLRTIKFANQSTKTKQEALDGQFNGAVLPDR